jgi:hypothetical protein
VKSTVKLTSLAVVVAVSLLCATFAYAQRGRGAQPAGPPQTARQAAPIDLTGYWVSLIVDEWRFRVTPQKGDIVYLPLNAQARQIANAWDPDKDQADGNACKAYGAVGIMQRPGRLHITWDGDQALKIETDAGTQTRALRFGPAPAQPGEPSLQGYSAAVWQVNGRPLIDTGGTGFGGRNLPAPQASLMALLAQGIVGGQMAWPLIIVGMLLGVGLILMQVRSPMLVSVGMYLPLETTFAIFVGGVLKGVVDRWNSRLQHNAAQKARVENNGLLLASVLIAGESLIGLLFAALAFADIKLSVIFERPSFLTSLGMLALIAWILIRIPLKNAGRPDEPPPPSAVM